MGRELLTGSPLQRRAARRILRRPHPLLLAVSAAVWFIAPRAYASEACPAPVPLTITSPDGVQLSGQLDLPAGEGKHPLIFMIQGLGRHDRDGNSVDWGELDNVRFMTHALTAEGFAVFRMDKRGVGRSKGQFSDDRPIVARDFAAAYAVAVARPEIDRTRIVIVAQSFGSIVLGRHWALFRAVQPPKTAVLLSSGVKASYVNNFDVPIHIVNGRRDWNPADQMVHQPLRAHRKRYGFDDTAYIADHADHALFDRRLGKTVRRRGGPGPYVMHAGALASILEWCKANTR